ncbi:MAG: CPBP family intramembrane metalloprotease [Planctomycetes bacterium]|nr:CPBP family intramembrane metalloprotease [Planctomycetota bacterium]
MRAMAVRRRAGALDLGTYLRLTRGVTVSIAYLLPLLAAYEVGVQWSGSDLRNSAELSLKTAAGISGTLGPWIQRAVLLGVLVVAIRLARRNVPALRLYPVFLLEAVLFALLLGPAAAALVDSVGLSAPAPTAAASVPSTTQRLLLSIGAGVYEELVFRFLLLAGGFTLLHRVLGFRRGPSLGCAVAVSALLFSGYHHLGPGAEPFTAPVFAFRAAAGLALGILFTWRGLALCAYLHAFYDMLCDLTHSGAAP